jgi:hypothetical protein
MEMVLLAVLAVSGMALARRAGTRPSRAGFLSVVLGGRADRIGAGYLLLSPAVAWPADLSLPLLLIWVAGTGLWLLPVPPRVGRIGGPAVACARVQAVLPCLTTSRSVRSLSPTGRHRHHMPGRQARYATSRVGTRGKPGTGLAEPVTGCLWAEVWQPGFASVCEQAANHARDHHASLRQDGYGRQPMGSVYIRLPAGMRR